MTKFVRMPVCVSVHTSTRVFTNRINKKLAAPAKTQPWRFYGGESAIKFMGFSENGLNEALVPFLRKILDKYSFA